MYLQTDCSLQVRRGWGADTLVSRQGVCTISAQRVEQALLVGFSEWAAMHGLHFSGPYLAGIDSTEQLPKQDARLILW